MGQTNLAEVSAYSSRASRQVWWKAWEHERMTTGFFCTRSSLSTFTFDWLCSSLNWLAGTPFGWFITGLLVFVAEYNLVWSVKWLLWFRVEFLSFNTWEDLVVDFVDAHFSFVVAFEVVVLRVFSLEGTSVTGWCSESIGQLAPSGIEDNGLSREVRQMEQSEKSLWTA